MKEPKFKVGDMVYFYDCFLEDVIKKDEVERIEYVDDTFWYHLKNQQFCHRKKELFETFEECKAGFISYYESLLRSYQSRPVKDQYTEWSIKNCKDCIEKIKEQEEVK